MKAHPALPLALLALGLSALAFSFSRPLTTAHRGAIQLPDTSRPSVARHTASDGQSPLVHGADASPADRAQRLGGLPPSDARNHALAEAAESWAAVDPAAALAWVAALRPDDGQAEALQRAFRKWIADAPADAATWLADNETLPLADVLIGQLASSPQLVASDPTLAVTWATLLAEPEARAQQVEAVLVAWARRDPAGATSFIRQTALLNATDKRLLLQRLAPPHG